MNPYTSQMTVLRNLSLHECRQGGIFSSPFGLSSDVNPDDMEFGSNFGWQLTCPRNEDEAHNALNEGANAGLLESKSPVAKMCFVDVVLGALIGGLV